ncbi:MAG: S8 family peptidase [Candidatus Promineifilaceae bacterium]|jgi:subtilisin family serine protease
MGTVALRPAWSEQFAADAIQELGISGPLAAITPQWAWGGSTGAGVRVAVVDTGIEYDHPALEGAVRGGVVIELDENEASGYRADKDEPPHDMAGHGTAVAGIIHALAPQAELYSVRVLGGNMTGRAYVFAGGLDYAIENGMDVVNMSLSTSSEQYYALFHDLADQAFFKNIPLVSAVNNIHEASYPSTYSSVISVAANESSDPYTYHYNPSPPVEFGAPGINVRVAWLDKQYATNTGNSFAAPHITGLVALIRAKHPQLTPFQIKTVLQACAANMRHVQ